MWLSWCLQRELIENCWNQKPEKRPTFDQITNEIRTNNKFIIDDVDKDEFDDYVEKADEYKTTFNTSKRLLILMNLLMEWEKSKNTFSEILLIQILILNKIKE